MALGVTRTGRLSEWKGLASANTAAAALRNVRLAQKGVTGPRTVFEGKLGLEEALGKRFRVEWLKESIEGVLGCSLKRYVAEMHTQSCIEGAIELRRRNAIVPEQISRVEVDIFRAAYDIAGGGEWGERETVATKEQADHSLPWLVAVAFLDGSVCPDQYTLERIRRADVQQLLQKVRVRPANDLSRTFPNELRARVRVNMVTNKTHEIEKKDYEELLPPPHEVGSSGGEVREPQYTARFGRAAPRHCNRGGESGRAADPRSDAFTGAG